MASARRSDVEGAKNPMNPILTAKEFRKAVYSTLVLSLPGILLVSSLLMGPGATLEAVAWLLGLVAAGYLGMILIVETVGIFFRHKLCGYGAGIVFGISLYLAGVISGSASVMIVNQEFDPWFLVGILYWMGIFGIWPAAFLGMVGTHMMRKIHRKNYPI